VLVVVREPLTPALEQRSTVLLAVALDETLEQVVVPGPGDLDDLALELFERDVGDGALPNVDREVQLREVALGDREVVVEGLAVEPLHEQVLQALAHLGVEPVAGDRDQQRHAAPVQVAPHEQPHVLRLLEVEQPHDLGAQLLC
jgi:hypothetical protein